MPIPKYTILHNELIISKETKIIKCQEFMFNKKFTKVSIPDSVTKIESGAFCNCENLKDLYIPNSVSV